MPPRSARISETNRGETANTYAHGMYGKLMRPSMRLDEESWDSGSQVRRPHTVWMVGAIMV